MNAPTYWPYDEVTLKPGRSEREVLIETPWLVTYLKSEPSQWSRIEALIEKFQRGSVGAEDILELNWFFGSLGDYPLCYILPMVSGDDGDVHSVTGENFQNLSPKEYLTSCLKAPEHEVAKLAVAADPLFSGDWKWDTDGALSFSTLPGGFDPKSLFTVARRFHLLSFIENDKTDALYALVRELKSDQERFNRASALMVRQNHYVTERCNSSLEPALTKAQRAKPQVEHFISEERGHDRLLGAALKSIVADPFSVPVVNQAKILMDLLRYSAEKNFLAFAMVVDAFERSSYQESDPLAEVLEEGGLGKAAGQINNHKDINDSGEHENLGLSFLRDMGPVDEAYAVEALRIAELTSNAMNLLSSGVRDQLAEELR